MTELNQNVTVNGPMIVNIFAGPGAGKSTTAAALFTLLKLHEGIKCELVTEFAKDLVWEEREYTFKNQFYLFAKQQHRIWRVAEKVDMVITDSPILLSNIHGKHNIKCQENRAFYDYVLTEFNSYNNINFFIERKKKYAEYGRNESESEALLIDDKIREYLHDRNIEYKSINGDISGINAAVNIIFELIDRSTQYELVKKDN